MRFFRLMIEKGSRPSFSMVMMSASVGVDFSRSIFLACLKTTFGSGNPVHTSILLISSNQKGLANAMNGCVENSGFLKPIEPK